MKFLPGSNKKRIWSVFVLLVSISGIIYLNVFSGPSQNRRPADQVYPPAEIMKPAESTSEPPVAAVPPSASSEPLPQPAVVRRGGLLPYGSKIDAAFLKSPAFRGLKPVPSVSVTAEELGKADLFR